MAEGLLGFLGTPAGQGLLAAAAGGLAGARRGTPVNNIGRGLLAGTAGYSQGLDRQTQEQQLAMQQRERDQMNELRGLQMAQARTQMEREQGQQAWRQGLPDVMKQATEASYGASDAGPTMTPANPDALKKYAMLPNSPFADEILKQNIMPKESSYKTVGDTMIRIGANGEVIPVFTAPQKPESSPSTVREYEYAVKNDGYKGTFQQFQTDLKRAGAPKVEVNTKDPTAVAKTGLDFTKQYEAEMKGSRARAQAYGVMLNAYNNPSPKGDIAMVYSMVKALDPESVVREGEVGLLEANRSVPNSIKGYARKLATGESLLPEERADMINQARALVMSDYESSRGKMDQYRRFAAPLGLDPNKDVPDPYAGIDFSPRKFDGKTVKRTGVLNGRKVVEYSDGSVSYAD